MRNHVAGAIGRIVLHTFFATAALAPLVAQENPLPATQPLPAPGATTVESFQPALAPNAGVVGSSSNPILVERPIDDGVSGFSISARTWLSIGQAERNHRLGDINVVSDLRWKNLVSEIFEVSASALLWETVTVNGEIGTGGISSGEFRDQDYDASGRQGLFSDTIHPVKDDGLRYFNLNIGWRLYEGEDMVIDALGGYQYWQETLVAEGGSRIFPPTLQTFPAGRVISEEFTWQGFRLGAQSIIPFSERCTLKTRVMLMPTVDFEMRDIHHLRIDLRQDPSIVDSALGGFGVMADVGVSYWLWRGLFAEVGYRVWDVQSGKGESLFRFSDGSQSQVNLNRGEAFRQGLTLGLTYQF